MQSLGLRTIFDYRSTDLSKISKRFDVAYDTAAVMTPRMGTGLLNKGACTWTSIPPLPGSSARPSTGGSSRSWRNTSTDSGTPWLEHWQLVPDGLFTSAPTLATSGNGLVLHAYALGGEFRTWGNHSNDAGQTWTGWGMKGSDVFL